MGSFLVALVIFLVLVIGGFLLSFIPVGLMVKAISAGVTVSPMAFIGMRLKKISQSKIVDTLIKIKSAGVPARLVVGQSADVWSEVWISGIGWIAVETALPIYDYGGANRISFPKNFTNDRVPVSSISGSDDDTKSIDWSPQLKASFKTVPEADLRDFSKLINARLLIIKPAEKYHLEDLPLESLIPIFGGHYMLVEVDPTPRFALKTNLITTPFDSTIEEIINYKVIICDSEKNIVSITDLKETGFRVKIELEDMTFEFMPKKIGEYLVFEIIKWIVPEIEVPEIPELPDNGEIPVIEVREGRRLPIMEDDLPESPLYFEPLDLDDLLNS